MRKNQIEHYLLEIWKTAVMILLIIALVLSCVAQLQYYRANQIREETLEVDRTNSEEMEKMLQETERMIRETKDKLYDLLEEEE